jgi:hypothetical protein
LIHARLAFPERLPGAIAQVKNEGEQQHRQDNQRESGANQQALPGDSGERFPVWSRFRHDFLGRVSVLS